MENKKKVNLNKEIVNVKEGKVVIESEELARAIQDEGIDLFVDEDAAAAMSNGIGFA